MDMSEDAGNALVKLLLWQIEKWIVVGPSMMRSLVGERIAVLCPFAATGLVGKTTEIESLVGTLELYAAKMTGDAKEAVSDLVEALQKKVARFKRLKLD